MLFSCVPETGGGEWANLKGFVAQLNSELGTKYERTACLDVEERNVKMPEILLEAPGSPPLVVENKVVAWPEDYCRRHESFHTFVNQFVGSLRRTSIGFNGSPYKLSIHEDSLDGMRLNQVRSLADELARQVHAREDEAKSKKGAKGSQPITWHFGSRNPEEWGEPASSRAIMVETQGSLEPVWESGDFKITDEESLLQFVEARNQAEEARRLSALKGIAASLDEAMKRAKGKFEKFDGHTKLLLLTFVGDSSSGISVKDIGGLVVAAELPTEIDEVWVAYPNWTSQWDYEYAWKRMR